MKFKEWSLRLKLVTADDKTMLLGLGREFLIFMMSDDSVCKEMAIVYLFIVCEIIHTFV